MKVYHKEIECCLDCPKLRRRRRVSYCNDETVEDMRLFNPYEIPERCPLPEGEMKLKIEIDKVVKK